MARSSKNYNSALKVQLPNVIIIGGQKCGTTSLHFYLDRHPDIQMSSLKETQFFNEEYNWKRGVTWYKGLFPGNEKIHGEACTSYAYLPKFKNVAAKMHSLVPDVKIIYLVRDPVERAISSYVYAYKGRAEHRSLPEVFSDFTDNEYLDAGRYYYQLEEYLRYFNPRQILIVATESLWNDRLGTLRRIFHFLNVDSSFQSETFFENKNVNEDILRRKKSRRFVRYLLNDDMKNFPFGRFLSSWQKEGIKKFLLPPGEVVPKPVLDETLKERMVAFFASDVKKLREFTDCAFSEWKNFANRGDLNG